MYQPSTAPIGDSLVLSALIAALPLITVFLLLGVARIKAHWAGLSGLAVALVVAVTGYGMPADKALLSASQGAAFGLLPVLWILVTAIWLHQLTVRSGRFEDLRAAFGALSPDPRVQAVVIAFCFGGLLEALAGFGAPVAITGMMLVALGFAPLRAAITVLLANTAPVAFGALGTPIITAGELTGVPYETIGAVVGRQTPVLALVVPLLLVAVIDGKRGMRETWPAALVSGVTFALTQFVCANFISVQLTDIVSALVGALTLLVLLRFWQPGGGTEARSRLLTTGEGSADEAAASGAAAASPLTTRRTLLALFPYLLVIVVFAAVKLIGPLENALAATDVEVPWPGLHGHVRTAEGDLESTTAFDLDWLSTPGSLLLLCGVVVALVLRVRPRSALQEFTGTVAALRWPGLTVLSVLALAYVMNHSGQTATVGTAIAGAGSAFVFLSPVLGWLGVAVTGSDTSANALFSGLQQVAAQRVGADPALLLAANTSGGVMGKMISPQNLAVAAAAVGLAGQEARILRSVLPWSLGLLVAMCALVFLQSGILAWTVAL